MRRVFIAVMIGSLALATIACDSEPAAAGDSPAAATPVTAGPEGAQPASRIAGTVVSSMDATNYTYVEVDTGDARIWAAGPRTPVKVGEGVVLLGASLMQNFHSNTLDRSFDRIYFVGSIQPASNPTGSGASGSIPYEVKTEQPPEPDTTGIVRAENGQTIAEIYQGKADLAGSEVAVRGVVVKVNARILGRNWIHLKDGTVGPGGEAKLIVTSTQTAEVGNTVLVRGILATDRDLGSGYHYDALVEEASVVVE